MPTSQRASLPRDAPPPSASWAASLVAALLWAGCALSREYPGFVADLLRAGRGTVPSGRMTVWNWSAPEVFVVPAGSALVLLLVHLLLTHLLSAHTPPSGGDRFLVLWLTAAGAGVLPAVLWEAGRAWVVSTPPEEAAESLLLLLAFWGLLWAWVPALAGTRWPHRASAVPFPGPALLAGLCTALALVVAASTLFVTAGTRAALTPDTAQDPAAHAQDPAGKEPGSFPAPRDGATPPPEVAPGEHDPDPAWCAPEPGGILVGTPASATGHRMLALRFTNGAEEPCVLDGYPDVAFADRDGAEIDVEVTHGSSFAAEDPGPAAVTVPVGGQAVATLGWGAMALSDRSTHLLYTAPYPGAPRQASPVELDLADGGEAAVTAWRLEG
ncbi:hypothetical protein A6A08_09100 [Nocardiopsis sp. TSRI0078]|uniref:DUF4232 domain-containing protein n=1 Tax=unclassified Nocardiopsis TaxID=2649073 RepID=UPI00093B4B54|nr:DUF4232 domain-containing protein [Nocardiopsis sp. TSRI0078]OKI15714.1 hypothetical protein A6A08_09100 [Nocardiopsis sp. TSRI0078]